MYDIPYGSFYIYNRYNITNGGLYEPQLQIHHNVWNHGVILLSAYETFDGTVIENRYLLTDDL